VEGNVRVLKEGSAAGRCGLFHLAHDKNQRLDVSNIVKDLVFYRTRRVSCLSECHFLKDSTQWR
jgi:hypothetical protein